MVDVQPAEYASVGWSWLFFYSVLTAYYVLRPIRDDMGVAGGVENLPWLFLGTLTGVALSTPAFGYLASRLPRERLVTASYRFLALNLVLFFALFHAARPEQIVWAGRAFFIWVAVFTMIANSIFWSVMADAYSVSQGRRLFGFIGVGGTLGAITGSSLTATLVGVMGAANLMLVSAALLEVSARAARRVFRTAPRDGRRAPRPESTEAALGGRSLDGLRHTLRDSYLRGIALHLLLFTALTTFLYFQQATIVDAAIADRVERTRFFAQIDLMVNVLTLLTQSLATAHLIRIFGLTAALCYLPALSVLGFAALGAHTTVGVLMVFQVLRRAGEFSIAKPAREVLFTVVPRADRYKAKNFIDTFVYRAGDQITAWGYTALLALGVGVPGTSVVAVVLGLVSIGVAVWLGRAHRRKAQPRHAEAAA
jgi:AAA family ATP:ADP antiporter